MKRFLKVSSLTLCSFLLTTAVFAGGVDPREVPEERAVREQVTASPSETSTAVRKARRAVAPAVEEVKMSKPRPKAAVTAGKDDWMLVSGGGRCEPLSAVKNSVKNIGTFKTPKEFSRQMQQRGYQAFAMDIGDVRNQVMRVKVPDMKLDLTFQKAGLCR